MRCEPDFGLRTRMILTVSLLVALYLVFLAVIAYYQLNLTIAIIFMGIIAFFQYYYSDRIVLWSLDAKPVSEAAAPELYQMVRRLCIMSDMPQPKIAIMDTEIPNAFATGRNQKNAVVAVTRGIIKQLSSMELEAVLAHELSHIKNRDMMIMTLAALLIDVAYLILRIDYFSREDDGSSGGDDESPVGAIVAAVMLASFLVYNIGTLLILALSRYREFSADRGAAIMTGKPSDLVSALMKISGNISKTADKDLKRVKGANALFIVPAINGKSLLNVFSTHPSLEKRIEALQCLEMETRNSKSLQLCFQKMIKQEI